MRDDNRSAQLGFGFEIHSTDVLADIGCGGGDVCVLAGGVGADVIAIDVIPDHLETTIRRMRGVRARSFRAIRATDARIPLPDGSVTAVVAREVLEHVDDSAFFLSEIHRVCAPGARLFLSVPHPASEALMKVVAPASYFAPPGHQHVFQPADLETLIQDAGFEIEARCTWGFYWAVWWALRMTTGTDHCPGQEAPPPVLAGWEATWRVLMDTATGSALDQTFDRLLPKSQIYRAKKVTAG